MTRARQDPESDPATSFAGRLLAWHRVHGRHDLPWQHPRDAWRVWVSEIMLQQTRVETVIGYFERFMARFPDVAALAAAPLDDVLALWSGLGYYARARNLHAAAGRVVDEFGGRLPDDIDTLATLPGIGRSTAAAIVAQAFGRRAVILDGNVKRVLARHAAVVGWPGSSAVERQLWDQAERRTPEHSAVDYSQAIMDLGAAVCTPRAPRCPECPVVDDCQARRRGLHEELPTPRPRRRLPERASCFLILRDPDARVLLERRPPSGIWGGLWCLPERGDSVPSDGEALPTPAAIRHVFSHFALRMRFEHRRIEPGDAAGTIEDADRRWFTLDQALKAGLPRPVRRVIERLGG